MGTIRENSPRRTGFPFGASRRDYQLLLQSMPVRVLLAEVEIAQWNALAVANVPGDSRAVAEIQLTEMVEELESRLRLLEASASDPLRPAWPRRDQTLKVRFTAVKAAWPIRRFLEDLLMVTDLRRTGPDRLLCRCPLPGHDDRTPSFVVYEATDSAYCFGCGRAGDVVKLAQYALNLNRPYDALEALERAAGTEQRGAA